MDSGPSSDFLKCCRLRFCRTSTWACSSWKGKPWNLCREESIFYLVDFRGQGFGIVYLSRPKAFHNMRCMFHWFLFVPGTRSKADICWWPWTASRWKNWTQSASGTWSRYFFHIGFHHYAALIDSRLHWHLWHRELLKARPVRFLLSDDACDMMVIISF